MSAAGLADIRVLDLGRYVAAPYCATVLGDLGAEVIRVEPPGGGEDRSLVGLRAAHGETFMFVAVARGKKGITLDLRHEGAREVLRDLVARSDVFLHNFAPAAATAFGVTYPDVRGLRADVIYAAVSCYGADGPYAGRNGFDPMAQVASGAAALTGYEGHEPIRAGVPWADFGTGLAAAAGILAALRHRDATGEGQEVACALLETALSYTAPMVAEALVGGRERPRLGNQPAYVGPCDLYPCRDGHVYVAAVTRGMWRALTQLVGRPELADDEELATPELRFERRERVNPVIERWTAERTVEDAAAALEAAHVPCAVYRTTAEVALDPQVVARGLLPRVDLGAAGLDVVPVSATPIRLSALPRPAPSRPPRAGEHNEDVYGGLLGYDAERLAELRADRVI